MERKKRTQNVGYLGYLGSRWMEIHDSRFSFISIMQSWLVESLISRGNSLISDKKRGEAQKRN